MRLGTEVGFFPEPEKFDPERVLAHFRAATSWYTVDHEVELTPEYATQVLIDMSDPRSEYFGQLRHESAPPDHIFGRRMEVLTLAVLSQLHATGNFHRIAREWFYDDEPATELGAPGGGVLQPRGGLTNALAFGLSRIPRHGQTSPRLRDGRAPCGIHRNPWSRGDPHSLYMAPRSGAMHSYALFRPAERQHLHALDLHQAGGSGQPAREPGGDPDPRARA